MDLQRYEELIQKLIKEIEELKTKVESIQTFNPVALEWQPRKEVMKFLGYGSTQMISFERKSGLLLSTVGKRIFVNLKSLKSILEKNASARK
jgi:hypothetical protein